MKIRLLTLLFLFFACFVFGVAIGKVAKYQNPQDLTVAKPLETTPGPFILNGDVLLNTVNTWRKSQNKSVFLKNDVLCEAAKVRLAEIKIDWSHSDFKNVAKKYLVNNYEVAENLAKDVRSEQIALETWLSSPSHKKTLESNYKYSCVVTDGTYAVQWFANFVVKKNSSVSLTATESIDRQQATQATNTPFPSPTPLQYPVPSIYVAPTSSPHTACKYTQVVSNNYCREHNSTSDPNYVDNYKKCVDSSYEWQCTSGTPHIISPTQCDCVI